MIWIKNTAGKEDAMLTLGVVTLGVVLTKFFLSEMSFGPIVFGSIDGGTIAALLSPTLGAYVLRRYTDANASKKDDSNVK
jgi:hypothetical protein